MSPVQRPISGPALSFALADELRIIHEQLATTSRTARTLVKNGPLRATLIGLAAGGELASHRAEGPITLHVLEGTLELEAEGSSYELPTGSLLALDAGIVHAVRSRDGGVFLLTVSAPAVEEGGRGAAVGG
ncbi:MAG TPA: cupin domain-containing protein [Gemmatimonadales bacterium]